MIVETGKAESIDNAIFGPTLDMDISLRKSSFSSEEMKPNNLVPSSV